MDRSPRETRRPYPRERGTTTFWTGGPNRNVNGDNWRREANEYGSAVSAAAAAANTAVGAATNNASSSLQAPPPPQQQQPLPNSGTTTLNLILIINNYK